MSKHKCPLVYEESEMAKKNKRQVDKKTRKHCLIECELCDNKDMLKKIYWELVKMNRGVR